MHATVRAALEEIKATPDDDAPRLMLADWLEENGTSEGERDRGTLLRLGCQAAARPRWDPLRHVEQRQAELLVRRHGWLGDLPPERFTLDRGLLRVRAEVEDADLLARLAGSDLLPWLGGLDLNVVRLDEATARGPARDSVAALVAGTRRLRLTAGRQDSPWAELLAHADTAALVALDLAGLYRPARRDFFSRPFDSLQELAYWLAAGDWICSWPPLRGLRLLHILGPHQATPDWPPGPWPVLEELLVHSFPSRLFAARGDWPRLRRLRALYGGTGQLPGVLARSGLLGQIESLELMANRGAKAYLAPLAGRAPATCLRRLTLSALTCKPDALPGLFAASNLSALREVELVSLTLDDRAAEALADASLLASVEALTLKSCHVPDAGETRLGASPSLLRLAHLSVAGTYGGTTLLHALLAQPEPARLVSLDLSRPRHSGFDPAILTPERLPDLVGLNLHDVGLQSADVRALAAGPLLRQLRYLDLTENYPDEASLRALLDSPHLADDAVVRITIDYGDREDLANAWRERFGYGSVVPSEIPF